MSRQDESMTHIAVIGAGLVGSSWALVFARAGQPVAVYDTDAASLARVKDFVRASVDDQTHAEAFLARLTTTTSLEEALCGADHVQESAPERLQVKRSLYEELDLLAAPDAILASSTSGFPASSFTKPLARRHRCLVVHPINPPHLIPLVEIVPAPWTAPEVVVQTTALMRAVGQSPVTLKREIAGFLVNRLQGAILGEAFRLIEDGICDADDVDRAVSDGLGRRWAFLGPLETIDLNANHGIAEYCQKLGPMYFDLAKNQADPRPWTPELVAAVEQQLRRRTPADGLAERRRWRDAQSARLDAMKRSDDQIAQGEPHAKS
jgi:3-hydroxyacyl-CoA dehydrogenase